MFEIACNEKGLAISFLTKEDMPDELKVDDQRIQQVVLNLLQNALKFTNEGSITVQLSYDFSNSNLVIDVKDTGIGISEVD